MFNIILTKLFKLKINSIYSLINIFLISAAVSLLLIMGGFIITENESYFQRREDAINNKYDCGYGSFGECLEVETDKIKAELKSTSVWESQVIALVLIAIGTINLCFETYWFRRNYH